MRRAAILADGATITAPDLQLAAAQRDAAKGGLLAAQASWDPQLNAGLNRPVSTDKNFSNGFTYKLSSSTVAWNVGLSQMTPTGTSWDLALSGAETSIDDLEIFGSTVEGFNNLRMSSNLSVSQQLLKGWRMSYNMRSVISAESNLSQAEATLLQQRQTTLANVATQYWDLYAAGATLTVAEEAVRVAKEEQRIVQALLDVGKVAPVERTRVDAALAQAEINLIDAESAYALASDQLALTLGLPLGMPISADTEPSDAPDGVRVPQLGWNWVEPGRNCQLLQPGYASYANSYALREAPEGWAAAWTTHGEPFIAAVERGAQLACQFHPELSGPWGQALLTRWLGAR